MTSRSLRSFDGYFSDKICPAISNMGAAAFQLRYCNSKCERFIPGRSSANKSFLYLLDIFAAFDTIDHTLPTHRLSSFWNILNRPIVDQVVSFLTLFRCE